SSYFQPLSWKLRMKVALDAAKGIAYLHSPETKVIYRDFKSSNILINYFPYNFHPFTTRTIMQSFLILGWPIRIGQQMGKAMYLPGSWLPMVNSCSQLVARLHLHLILIVAVPLPIHLPLFGFTC
ncbi:hypothetical protein RJ639_029658, partial [Escallonia herrerae]